MRIREILAGGRLYAARGRFMAACALGCSLLYLPTTQAGELGNLSAPDGTNALTIVGGRRSATYGYLKFRSPDSPVTLDSVSVRLRGVVSPVVPEVALLTDSSGSPGSAIASATVGGGETAYTAAAQFNSLALEPSTVYWVWVRVTGVRDVASFEWVASNPLSEPTGDGQFLGCFHQDAEGVLSEVSNLTPKIEVKWSGNAAQPFLSIEPAPGTAGKVIVTFSGILQESFDLASWSDVFPQPVSPVTISKEGTWRFFRARSE